MNPYYQDEHITLFHRDCFQIIPELDMEFNLLLTDPPYGINFVSNHRKKKHNAIENDADLLWIPEWLESISKKMGKNAHSYIFCSHHGIETFMKHNRSCFPYKNLLVWVKNNTGMGDLAGDYAPKHELCIFNSNGKRKLNGTRDSNILYFSKTGNKLHPTEKPEDMFGYLIRKSTVKGELVIDPFAGSGTTGVAAKKFFRKCVLIEKDKDYCDIIVKRLEQEYLFCEDDDAIDEPTLERCQASESRHVQLEMTWN